MMSTYSGYWIIIIVDQEFCKFIYQDGLMCVNTRVLIEKGSTQLV
jgi:hypothetical protein